MIRSWWSKILKKPRPDHSLATPTWNSTVLSCRLEGLPRMQSFSKWVWTQWPGIPKSNQQKIHPSWLGRWLIASWEGPRVFFSSNLYILHITTQGSNRHQPGYRNILRVGEPQTNLFLPTFFAPLKFNMLHRKKISPWILGDSRKLEIIHFFRWTIR